MRSIPNGRELRAAQKNFETLLANNTLEADWQRFFKQYPFVLSRALPLRLEPEDIIPLGRPGISEPDVIFYPNTALSRPNFGVIELKRPNSIVVTSPRKRVITLTRDADTAVKQVQRYSRDLPAMVPPLARSACILGNSTYMFIIMGLSSHLSWIQSDQSLQDQWLELLPKGVQLMAYDSLFREYERTVRRRIFVLTPETTLGDLHALWPFLERVSPREQFVVEQYYAVGHTIAEIAEMLGISEARVSQIHVRAMSKLRRAKAGTLRRPVDPFEQTPPS